MSGETIAERYARAIFELGVEGGELAGLVEDMRKVAEAYRAAPDMQKLMNNPLIPETARLAAVAEIADRLELSPLGRNAAGLLTRQKRMFAIPAIVVELDRLSDEMAGVVRATVVSAEPLSEAYTERLTHELMAMTGKKIALDRRLDPELLAGVVVRVGDQVIDGSARARLAELKSQLLSA